MNAANTQKPAKAAKPPIAAKPKIAQKTNYVVLAQTPSDHSTPRAIPTPTRNLRLNTNAEQMHFTVGSANHFSSLPSSSSPMHMQHLQPHQNNVHRHMGEFTNDFLNKQYQMEYSIQQQQRHNNNHNNGTQYTNGVVMEQHQNDYNRHKNELEMTAAFHTPSHSFDSSSSSSGGFKEHDFIAKTKAVYEMYDKSDDKSDYHEASSASLPYVGHSKIQEIQSKLLQQQLQQNNNGNNNHHHESHSIAINRQQYQKSSKELEKLLGMRIEKKIQHSNNNISSNNTEKPMRRLSRGYDEIDDNGGGGSGVDIASLTSKLAINISKQIQQKLQQEMKQQCEMIKEKFLIEKVPVQQHYTDYVVKMGRTYKKYIFQFPAFHPFFICFTLYLSLESSLWM